MDDVNKKKLFVGGLRYGTDENTLREFFEAVGTVDSAAIITDRETGRSKGFGFVEMSTEEEAEKAVNELNGKELDGREISVNIARPKAA